MTNRRSNFVNMVKHLSDVPSACYSNEIKITQSSPFRQAFHIESESGSLGDPNGFSYFNGNYHLFHQWSPLAFSKNPHYTQHGWRHLISSDLVHWQNLGAGMESDSNLDLYGTYSGSALAVNDILFIFYTGNTWKNTESLDNWQRVPYQVGAYMDKKNHIIKNTAPFLTGPLKGYTSHFRDPKVFKKDNHYYAVLGIQRDNLTGTALLISSPDLHDWNIVGEIKTNYSKFGYMWECPDYFEIGNYGILNFCPQGLEHYPNIYQAGYLIGNKMNLKTGEFFNTKFYILDEGFDFYAPQTMKAPDGRRILSAWMGISEIKYPTEKYHYTGCLIFPREVNIKAGKIIQKPIHEITHLYKTSDYITKNISNEERIPIPNKNQRDITFTIGQSNSKALLLDIFADEKNKNHLRIIINQKKNYIVINRAHSSFPFAEEYGEERKNNFNLSKNLQIRIIQDISSAEIFINNGEHVFSLRYFAQDNQTNCFITSIGGESKVSIENHQLSL
ncbi:glycoside hydrolase family 32 protein [Lactobacillus mulieris]|uniref:Sucrose-6-phosphate hydrolase n=1 Tax=Lactobacillus mulieris TaxID=2508708 RepID=A0AAW5WX72_9LACO|nr:sucrose-6-phosphate hydrolase [Lactobacillus mulieris]MCZ3622066.1 sucrose-6-phosphate hydrolase [Lactobacillus mulieris]MCZ3623763.1 sucrose-6-phosphate hydrolase [Lactobacillus mulieris]MCZ3636073.1 sucrose-6-phosphate hydrolase [Lactobacillus mulieris]MCZ3689996.1 sucrose-6-phosphate hydrolase [Lactobacillus mulieris]MCZ3696175.1 sucrose-6-phosphate hydrolase [Lactobacillus mulieris]